MKHTDLIYVRKGPKWLIGPECQQHLQEINAPESQQHLQEINAPEIAGSDEPLMCWISENLQVTLAWNPYGRA